MLLMTDEDERPDTRSPFVQTVFSLVRRHIQKIGVVCFWLVVLITYQWYAWSSELTPLEVVRGLIAFFSQSIYGPFIFILVYALRPLVFFSATFLSISAGLVFGPVLGLIYTVIGSNLSAMVGYMMGRYIAPAMAETHSARGIVQHYAHRMRHHSFKTVITMRLMFLHYDLVSCTAGFLRINWKPFIVATVIGSLPGSLTFVLFGSSIETLDGSGIPAINPLFALPLAAILVLGILCSRLFRRQEALEK